MNCSQTQSVATISMAMPKRKIFTVSSLVLASNRRRWGERESIEHLVSDTHKLCISDEKGNQELHDRKRGKRECLKKMPTNKKEKNGKKKISHRNLKPKLYHICSISPFPFLHYSLVSLELSFHEAAMPTFKRK